MPKKKSHADSLMAELARISANSANPVSQADFKAALATMTPKAKPKPSVSRGILSARRDPRPVEMQPRDQGTITATPTGTWTEQAGDWLTGALGDNRSAARIANKAVDTSNMVNPLSWATNFGHASRRAYDDPTASNLADAGFAALDVLPVEKAGALLAHAALPAAKKALRKGGGKIVEEMVPFRHYSFERGLTEADPGRWGSNPNRGFIPREELARKGKAPGRTYIGLDDGPKPYDREHGVGPHEYRGEIERSKLYDMAGDPDGLKVKGRALPKDQSGRYLYNDQAMDGVSLYERLIQDHGYKGYWIDDPMIGRAGALFEPHPLTPVRRDATAADFSPKNIPALLERDNWAILTGENPMGVQGTPEANAQAMQALKTHLDDNGIEYIDGGVGKYGNQENVLALLGVDEARAAEIGKQFNQDSVLTNRGLVYHDGRVAPAKGVNTFDQAPEDFYTELPNGSRFAVDIDFDNIAQAPQAPAILKHRPTPEADWGYAAQYTGLKNRPAPEVGFEQTRALADRAEITPEDLYGGYLVAGMSDRTRAGGILSSINDRKLIEPVNLQGGQDFMREQAAAGTGALWASDKGPMTGVLNTVDQLDGPAYYAPFTMGGKGGDYSTMMSHAVLGQLEGTTKKARKAFDAKMRQLNPDWIGMENLDNLGALREQLVQNPGMRTSMAKLMDNKGALEMGLPDIGATRQAITDPRLATVPTESFGNNIGVLSGRSVDNPALTHETYRTQIGGDYLGSMETPVPTNLMFPDFFNEHVASGGRREDVAYRLKRGVKVQKTDQQWLDNIMPWYERERERGTNWSNAALLSGRD